MQGFPFLSFPFLSFLSFLSFLHFHFIFLLTTTGQTGKQISMVEGSNDAFPPKKVPFWGLIEKIEFTGSISPKNRQKEGVVYDFPAKLGESIKTHISVKSRSIDSKFDL
jgi:hypothetical protein